MTRHHFNRVALRGAGILQLSSAKLTACPVCLTPTEQIAFAKLEENG
jgi:hypothetical protein